MDSQALVLLVVIVIALVVAGAAWMVYRRKQSERLRHRFGPEYTAALNHYGSEQKAEAELMAREKRVSKLTIRPLGPAEAARFAQAWRTLQARFVDNPTGVVAGADELVRELMNKRGYPMADFERRAADISVDYPDVVSNYRAAQAIAERDRRGEADTEELRRAVVHYRALFEELLEAKEAPEQRVVPNHRMEARS
jgi:hypothetical protein